MFAEMAAHPENMVEIGARYGVMYFFDWRLLFFVELAPAAEGPRRKVRLTRAYCMMQGQP